MRLSKILLTALVGGFFALISPAMADNEMRGMTIEEVLAAAQRQDFAVTPRKLTEAEVAKVAEHFGPQPIPGDLVIFTHEDIFILTIVGEDGKIAYSSPAGPKEALNRILGREEI